MTTKSKRLPPKPRMKHKIFPNSTLSVKRSMPKLVQLFNAIYNKSYILEKYSTINKRRLGNKFDEYDVEELWEPINEIVDSVDIRATKWVKLRLTENEQRQIRANHEEGNKLSEYENAILIIIKRTPTLSNILHIAVNLGGYKGHIEGMGTNHNPQFKFNNMNDFIDATNMAVISSKIDSTIVEEIMDYLNEFPEYEKPKMLNRTVRRQRRITNTHAINRNLLVRHVRNEIKKYKMESKSTSAINKNSIIRHLKNAFKKYKTNK